jgi:hypothetical protein
MTLTCPPSFKISTACCHWTNQLHPLCPDVAFGRAERCLGNCCDSRSSIVPFSVAEEEAVVENVDGEEEEE